MDDWELDSQARAFASRQKVPYAVALSAVAASTDWVAVGFAAPGRELPVRSDVELDARASEYMRQHGVSYFDALKVVARDEAGRTDFSEAVCAIVAFDEFAHPSGDGRLGTDWIEIFKSGTHITQHGQAITFNHGDIDSIAEHYQPSMREAPLVVGHPEHDKPAMGWVEALQANSDGRLLMRARQVLPEFGEAVRQGRFKKRSAAFYPPRHPLNPVPGKWYLRHVGFLGALQPAVAGLKDIGFVEGTR